MSGDEKAGLLSVSESAGIGDLGVMAGQLVFNLDAAGPHSARAVLKQAVAVMARAEKAQLLAVRQARGAGLSWKVIGDYLGTSAQAAHQRFSKLV